MDKEKKRLNSEELNELEELVDDIENETDLAFAMSYVNKKEKEGYDVILFKDLLYKIDLIANWEKDLDSFIEKFNLIKKGYNLN